MAKPASTKLPIEPLLRHVMLQDFGSLRTPTATETPGWTFTDFADLLAERSRLYGIDIGSTRVENLRQWRRRGLTWWTAEKVAACFDVRPEAVWGEEWSAVVGPLLELDVDYDEEDLDG